MLIKEGLKLAFFRLLLSIWRINNFGFDYII